MPHLVRANMQGHPICPLQDTMQGNPMATVIGQSAAMALPNSAHIFSDKQSNEFEG